MLSNIELENTNLGRYYLKQGNSKRMIHEGQISLSRGFVPFDSLPQNLPSEYQIWDQAASELPELLRTFKAREFIRKIPVLDASNSDLLPDQYLARASIIIGALAHAFYYYEKDHTSTALPKSIMLPWTQICSRIGRPYTGRNNFDTFLCNWKIINSKKSNDEIGFDDFELLIPIFNNTAEKYFNLTVFFAEWRFAKAIPNIIKALNAVKKKDEAALITVLANIAQTIEQISKDLDYINPNAKSRYYVDPVIWAKTVARIDEAILPNVAGVSGALSPLFHCMDTFLERKTYHSPLGEDILSKRNVLAPNHLGMLKALALDLEELSLHNFVGQSNNSLLKGQYKQLEESFSGVHGWQGRHRQKVFGFMKMSFRAGRLKTNGGQEGTATLQTEPATDLDRKFQESTSERYKPETRTCPFAKIKSNSLINAESKVYSLSFDTSNSGIYFQSGDRCEVYPKNDIQQVKSIYMELKSIIQDENLTLNSDWIQYFVSVWSQNRSHIPLWDFLFYVDLSTLDKSNNLVNNSKPIQSRAYSVSLISANGIDCTIGACEYVKNKCLIKGVSSNFLTTAPIQETVPIRKLPAYRFHLPNDSKIPIVMIAAGTGISPFIGFIQERYQDKDCGENWLFYSVKTKTSVLYASELEAIEKQKNFKLVMNYSRETHGIDESLGNHSKRLSQMMVEEAPQFYICGSNGFADKAKEALIRILQKEKDLREPEARNLVETLIVNNRIHIDAFSTCNSKTDTSYTIQDVCLNNWVMINNSAYNFTSIAITHEGGSKILNVQTGLDASKDFIAVHQNHPQVMQALNHYYKGSIRQAHLRTHPYYQLCVNFLYSLQEMLNSLKNNSSFADSEKSPLYLWNDIYSNFLIGPVPYAFRDLLGEIPLGRNNFISEQFIPLLHKATYLSKRVAWSVAEILGKLNSSELIAKEVEIRNFYICLIADSLSFVDRCRRLTSSALNEFEANTLDAQHVHEIICSIQNNFKSYLLKINQDLEQFIINNTKQGNSMKYRKNFVVIVDGVSNGRYLAPAFLAMGYNCIHVQTPLMIESLAASLNHTLYDENIVTADISSALLKLAKYANIIAVLPGQESGVTWADSISNALGLKNSNGIQLSAARRDKFVMQETIKSAGLNHIPHFKANNLADIQRWIKENGSYPIVVKPIQSAGTEGFYLCHNEKMVEEAFNSLYKKENIFHQINDEVLVQQYIDGQEYNVNFISCAGKHFLSEIWKVDKVVRNDAKMYELTVLLPQNAPEYLLLKEYAEQVLNAVGIKYGPSHCELIIDTKSNKPVLVEVAARLMGGVDFGVVAEATGTNAAVVTAEAYVSPLAFAKRFQTLMQQKHIYMVQLLSDEEGVFASINEEQLQRLPTLKGYDIYLNPGDKMYPTRDLWTCPGLVFLVDENLDAIKADYTAIRKLEESKQLYRLQAPQPKVYSENNNNLTFKSSAKQPEAGAHNQDELLSGNCSIS